MGFQNILLLSLNQLQTPSEGHRQLLFCMIIIINIIRCYNNLIITNDLLFRQYLPVYPRVISSSQSSSCLSPPKFEVCRYISSCPVIFKILFNCQISQKILGEFSYDFVCAFYYSHTFFKNIACIYLCVCATAYIWTSDDNFQEPVFSFYHMGPGDRTQIARLSHLTSPPHPFLKMDFLSGLKKKFIMISILSRISYSKDMKD